ncbi:MAG: Na/Pi cotransporter family protein [Lachnospiraceae bacterium]|nr:Na/Pi cotransporter family protein [Lachnospiraceae bacterium]
MTYVEIFLLAGGLGLFLFGMNIMGSGLKSLAGEQLQNILERATRKPILGVALGTGATALVQSSGATVIMTIGFVSSGMMTLEQSVGVIMGANIGTTITGQIIAFHLTDFAPLILLIGAVLFLFIKNDRVHSVAQIILGFGMLFVGVKLMGDAVEPLRSSAAVIEVLDHLANPWLAMLIGLIVTSILQSSSSSVGIIQIFAMQGLLDVRMAVFMVVGTSIGAVVPELLASLSSSRNGKRAALAALVFNIFRTILCAAVLLIFPQILDLITASSMSAARQIAVMHTVMAIVSVLVLLPFSRGIAAITRRILPITDKEMRSAQKKLVYITNLDVPVSMKLAQARLEMMRMAHMAVDNLKLSIEAFFDRDAEKAEAVKDTEEVVDYLCHHITSALVSVRTESLSEQQLNQLGGMLRCASDFERVSDLAENIAEYTEDIIAHNYSFSSMGQNDMHKLCEKAVRAVDLSIEIYENHRLELVPESNALEEEIDALNQQCVENHISRVMKGVCNPRSGVVFAEMASDLERAADHAHNVVKAVDGLAPAIDMSGGD